jgi:5-formyltetrahydrofolate cyclo-ligase
MATPGLRDGFYEITAEGVPVSRRREAVSSRGVVRFGRRLNTEFDEIGRVDLLVTGAVAVAMRGERLGKGTGFFDLEYQILRKVGSIHDETPVVTVVHDYQVFDVLPHSPHDVPVCGIVTPTRWLPISDPVPVPSEIDWGLLHVKLVTRMRPLRELLGKNVR